jgi:hypothetical protein
VGDLARFGESAKARAWDRVDDRMSPPMFRKRRRRVALRNRAESAILTKPKDTELGLTNAHRLF